MGLCWGHLKGSERAVIQAERRRGASLREIGRKLRGRWRHRPGNVEDHPPARGGGGASDSRPLGRRHDQEGFQPILRRHPGGTQDAVRDIAKMEGNGAVAALEGFIRQMKRLPAFLRRSLNCDRRLEMARRPELARRLKIDIRFCDPHASWQRGWNRNTNGLLRQFLPKGTDLSVYSQRDLDYIARLMNDRPRKTLGWRTPANVFATEIVNGLVIGT